MNWLTNIRPKIRALVGPKKEIPDNLWEKCPGCSKMLFRRELEENLCVCRHYGSHNDGRRRDFPRARAGKASCCIPGISPRDCREFLSSARQAREFWVEYWSASSYSCVPAASSGFIE